MTKIPQTRADLETHLREQIQFMLSSAESYDKGFSGEARRLANCLRLLLHDTNHSHSLLQQLDLKTPLLFIDTATDYDPANTWPHYGLTPLRMSFQGVQFVPRLGDFPLGKPKSPFSQWWDALVIVDSQKNQFTRKSLVLAMADQDGGAHVDPALDEKYALLSRSYSIGLQVFQTGKEPMLVPQVELASVRQVAYEVLESLKEQAQQYF